jgi:hypothetical protein
MKKIFKEYLQFTENEFQQLSSIIFTASQYE